MQLVLPSFAKIILVFLKSPIKKGNTRGSAVRLRAGGAQECSYVHEMFKLSCVNYNTSLKLLLKEFLISVA